MKHSIKHLIIATVGLLVAIIVAVGVLGLTMTSHAVGLLEGVSLRDARQQAMLGNIMLRAETNRSQILQALQHNPETKYAALHDHPLAGHFTTIQDNTAELRKAWDEFHASLQTAQAKAMVNELYEASNGLGIDDVSAAQAALARDDWDGAEKILITRINPGFKKGQQAYQHVQEFLGQRGKANSIQAHKDIGNQDYLMAAAVGAGILLGLAAAIFLLRSIFVPLNAAMEAARRVAHGDLSVQIVSGSHNEFGQLLDSLAEMNAALGAIVGEVREGTDTIANESAQIASGNMDLSGRTEAQASALEETAASVEELTTTVRQNADSARQANVLAGTASTVAERGGVVVAEVVQTMGAINASARKIVDIISVIDGIAFQTNILALNAAVEAARAGEQGRGFAVVASEVRNLAQRSAGAAREIKTLITDSVSQVESGSLLVEQAGKTMHEIVGGIRNVADIMAEISAASAEQSAGIEQIHQAVSQMDHVTQQNAALVEEAASAAQALQERASGLSRLVSRFRLDQALAHGAPARPMPAGGRARHGSASPRLAMANVGEWENA
jgi:methyl-accepting chemotaxis protein